MKHLLILVLACVQSTLFSQSNNVGIGTTNPDNSAVLEVNSTDKGVLIPRMNSIQRQMITSPAEGLMVFDISTHSFWYYTTEWTEIAKAEIEDGLFELNTDAIVPKNITHDFIIGDIEIAPAGSSGGGGSILFFDVGKSAFRSGHIVNSTAWNADSLGVGSFATGLNCLASGSQSLSMGRNSQATANGAIAIGEGNNSSGYTSIAAGFASTASADFSMALGRLNYATDQYAIAMGSSSRADGLGSVALGEKNRASGDHSSALGYNTHAFGGYTTAFGQETVARAYNSTVIGRWNDDTGSTISWIATDPLFQIGNGTDINNKSNAFSVLKNGTVSFQNYTFPLADGNADQVLSTDGNGQLTWKEDEGVFQNIAGVVSNTGNNILDDFVFGSDHLPGPVDESATLFFFNRSKGAFRAGRIINSTNWHEDSLGLNSFACGLATKAMGPYSFATGDRSLAATYYSNAMGFLARATGYAATAIGGHTEANAHSSVALGRYNVGGGSVNNWVLTDPLFEIGNSNDSQNRSNALTIYKNGVAEFADSLHTEGNINIGNGLGSRIYLGNTMMQSGGPTILRMDTNIRPFSDDSYDLGSSGKRWQDIWATNGVIQTSDRRLKKNIQEINYGLEEVLSMQPVKYNWNKDDVDSKKHLGLIAQDLLKVIPEVVTEEGEYLGVKYAELVPVLIEAIKDQNELILKQETEISILHEKNEQTQGSLKEIFRQLTKLKQIHANSSADE